MGNLEKKPVKVLAIVAQLNGAGLENRLMDILRNIDYSRVQIDVFTYHLEEGIYDQEVKELGSKIYYNHQLTVKNMFSYIKFFKKFLEEHPEYKIVHAYQDAWCTVFCKGAFLAGVPIRIAHSRTAITTKSLKNLCKNIIKIPAKKYATHYFAVSDKAGKWLFGEKAFNSGKVQIWENAIDCKKFIIDIARRNSIREEMNISQEKFVLIHVGNFTKPKNHVFLIDIFARIVELEKNSLLLLVGGDTPVEQNMDIIKKKVQDKGLEDRVIFLGKRTDIPHLLQAGDVFVFPSFFEGFPGAVLEAQAAGLPCIISSSITKEVCLLDSTCQVALDASLDQWVSEILKAKTIVRKNTYKELSDKGYDIHKLIEKLTLFYTNMEG